MIFEVPDDGELEQLEDLRAGSRGPLGEWVVLDADRRQVVTFDRTRRYRRTLVDRRQNRNVVDLEIDERGRLWVLDREQEQVLRYELDGTAEGPVISREWRRPEALTVDAIGNVYVLDRDAKTVDIFAPNGQLVATVGPVLLDQTELRSPRDVAVDGAGRLYIADRDLETVLILE